MGVTLYLTGPEGDSVVELHAVLLLAVVQPLPADADGHGPQVVVNPEIVLMLWWGQAKRNVQIRNAPSITLKRTTLPWNTGEL